MAKTVVRERSNRLPRAGRPIQPRFVLGLMAGTSGDGIDAACARIDGRGERMKVQFAWHHHEPFASSLRRRLLAAMAPAVTTTEEITRLHAELGEAFAAAACRAVASVPRATRPVLIGLAGQTIGHLPDERPYRTATLQLGEAARVAHRTGLPTVCDFRQSDVAAGGQGAPLVPWTDWVLFRSPVISRVVQNIGGIGNVTWLPAGGGPDTVVAFDTGPGNMVIDALVTIVTNGRERMDRDGRRAARGRVLVPLLQEWLRHPYFKVPPPKSTGRELFGRPFVERQLPRMKKLSSKPEDWIATATAWTAHSIAQAYSRFLSGQGLTDQRLPKSFGLRSKQTEMILCGGGAANPVLVRMLGELLPAVALRRMSELGIPEQSKEAISFAMLAAARVDQAPANLPQATGARAAVLLGRLVAP